MRTIEIGWWTPAIGVTPGMRRPVRMMTLPSTSSRRMRLGEPTSSSPSGVIVAALIPKPQARIACAASLTTAFAVVAAVGEREVVALELDREPDDVGIEHAQRLLEQLLAGLVALEDDDRQRVGHRLRPVRARPEHTPAAPCGWIGAEPGRAVRVRSCRVYP